MEETEKTVRVYNFIDGTMLFGEPDADDDAIVCYPRMAEVNGKKIQLFLMVGDPVTIRINKDKIIHSYDLQHEACCAMYWNSRKPKSQIIVPNGNMKLI
jgi:hypothetical protein